MIPEESLAANPLSFEDCQDCNVGLHSDCGGFDERTQTCCCGGLFLGEDLTVAA